MAMSTACAYVWHVPSGKANLNPEALSRRMTALNHKSSAGHVQRCSGSGARNAVSAVNVLRKGEFRHGEKGSGLSRRAPPAKSLSSLCVS